MPDTITIGGREFRVGATYAPRKPGPRTHAKIFLELVEKPSWGTCVRFTGRRGPSWVTARSWLRWAGDEVAP